MWLTADRAALLLHPARDASQTVEFIPALTPELTVGGIRADIVEIKHIMLPPSPREFKDIYVVFELMETDLHQVQNR